MKDLKCEVYAGLNEISYIKNCWNKTFESSLAFLQIACSLRLFKMSGIFG